MSDAPNSATAKPEAKQEPRLLPKLASPVSDPHTQSYSHINGQPTQLLDRLAVAELARGWPVYRDGSEWANFRSLFARDAWVWTTWSGRLHIDDFIAVSKQGKARGAQISHRENGTLVELSGTRAVAKMKATISQRFGAGDAAFDVDCDCRFLFFCAKDAGGEWRAVYVKLIYDKDAVAPRAPGSDPLSLLSAGAVEAMASYPEGYRLLGAFQSTLGYEIDANLATGAPGLRLKRMYAAVEDWLAGREIDLVWDDLKGKDDEVPAVSG